MKRRAIMAAFLATMAALMTAPSLASTVAPPDPAPRRDAADPSIPPMVPADGRVVPDAPEPTEAVAPAATDTPTAPPKIELAQPSAPSALPSPEPAAPAIAPDPLLAQPTARAVAEAPATTLPAPSAMASTNEAPAGRSEGASGEGATPVGGRRMPIDPFVVAGAIGLALGIGLAAGWLATMRRAQIARVREAAEAQSRASLALQQRTLRRARSRSSHDLIVDAPTRGESRGSEGR